ncbi:MAG: hypothetical protein RJA20_91 [Bacteroidota bacterium]|jgi:hypothetical protein
MNWNYVKSNWFSISCVCILLLIAVNRYQNKLMLQNPPQPRPNTSRPGVNSTEAEFSLGTEKQVKRQAREIDAGTAGSFLRRFSKVAVSERKKFGIPASVLIGTAFINSHAGLDDRVGKSENYFMIPCDDDWEGDTYSVNGFCVRKYETAWDGWRDFSIYMASQTWFGELKKSAGKDWRKWVDGIRGEDISRVDDFNRRLAEVVTYYKLYELDTASN